MKRYVTAVIMAWIIFVGIDFLFHAGIFASLWNNDIPVFKSTEELAKLIPMGYLSALILTVLIGYLFFKLFEIKPALIDVVRFGSVFGLLFSTSNLLGMFSYLDIPMNRLLLINIVTFIEIIFVTLTLYFVYFAVSLKRVIWYTISCFIILLVSGIVIQNSFK